MATQTSLVTQQVRIRQWAEQIRDCQNRPAGMDVETWCAQNNLTKSNYYYRLRRVRKACLDQIPAAETPAFIELPAPVSKEHDLCRQTLAKPCDRHGTCRPHSKHKRAVSGNISRCITGDHLSACRDIPSC